MEENGTWGSTCLYCGTFNSFLEGTDNGTGTCIFCSSGLRNLIKAAGYSGSGFEDYFPERGDSENEESKQNHSQ
jgi:predicted nucleic acid-binding Zn ribbon protein